MSQGAQKSVRSGKSAKRIQRMPRFPASDVPTIKFTQIVAGPEVELINISKTGACLGSGKSLAPGALVRMKFVSDQGTFTVSGFVVRSNLFSLKNGVPYYHAGVRFSGELALELGNRQSILEQLDDPLQSPMAEPAEFLHEPSNTPNPDIESGPDQTIFELTASVSSSMADLKEMLKGCESNSWVDF